MKIIAFHLLNDYSGSPKVLRQLLKGWTTRGLPVTMVTCSGRKGFLSGISGVQYRYFWYRWAANPFIRLLNFSLSQLLIIVKFLFMIRKGDIIYINTVLPFGAAILGKLKGCRVVYHVHEVSVKPLVLKKFLFGVVRLTADEIICVSDFLAKQEPMPGKKIYTLYNAIEDDFLETARLKRKKESERQNVLMVCSLKWYKGIYEFVSLAAAHPRFHFRLVVSATQQEIDLFFKNTQPTSNLEVYPFQKNMHPSYAWADLVLNLSRPDRWVETFGLTVIEAMSYGLPVIVPPVGGIAELVEEGKNGFHVDSRDTSFLSQRLTELLGNQELYEAMREEAGRKITKFSEEVFVEKNLRILIPD